MKNLFHKILDAPLIKKNTRISRASLSQLNPRSVLRAMLVVAAYLSTFIILDLITKQFEELRGIVAWYPPAGLTYTLLLVFGVRFTPVVTMALFLSSLFVYRIPQPPFYIFLWALVNSIIYSATAWFLRHRIRFNWRMQKRRDISWLIGATILVSGILATIAVSASAASGDIPRSEILRSMIIWWIGETVGVLTIAPFLLNFVMPGLSRFVEKQPVRLPSYRSFPRPTPTVILQALSIAVLFYWVFISSFLVEFRNMYLIILPLIWIALQHGFKGATVGIVALNFGASLAMLYFHLDQAHMGELQLLMIVNNILGLQLGAVVTEQKQSAEALRESEKELKRAQSLGLLGNWSYDIGSQTISWSEQVYLLYERDPILGPLTPDEEAAYYSPEQAQILREYSKRAIEEGESFEYDLEANLPNGKQRYLSAKMQPVIDANGQIVKLFGTVQDVTERKQREAELQTRTGELTELYQLSRALADAGDLENVIGLVNRHAVESLHITFSCISLLENGKLVRRAIHPVGILGDAITERDKQPINALPACQSILEKNEPVILQHDSAEIGSSECATLLLDHAQTICVVPLRVGYTSQDLDPALGFLILGEQREEEREPFTPGRVRMVRSIGDQAATAIRRMLLDEHARHRLQHLASLSEIDRTIASVFDLRLILDMILKHVNEQLEVDAADILVANTSLHTLEFAAGRGFRSQVNGHLKQQMGKGLAGRAYLERRMVQIHNAVFSEADLSMQDLIKAEQISSYFAVPLIIKGQVNGVLEIYQRTPLIPDQEWLNFLDNLAGQAAIAIDNDKMYYGLQHSIIDLRLAYNATIEGWSHALDLRDKETDGHTRRVTEMTEKLACMLGLDAEELVYVRWGALLHDIGNMGVSDVILLKPGPLTDEEWVLMKRHPTFAYELLSPIKYLKTAVDIPYCHHEKWDGTGYPRSLKGEQIPLIARLFAVVDVWDVLLSDRPFRAAWPEAKVFEHIRAESGSHFDPKAVEIFLKVLELEAKR
ncbi:MAG: hypothetical protein C0391_03530 [Anaerolinea sp.]|nr:hypothetical protein [Anaerolinea sp.]